MRKLSKRLKNTDITKKRARLLVVFLSIFAMGIMGRLFQLQAVNGSYYKSVAEEQYEFFQKLHPTRGEIKIVDRQTKATYIVATSIKKPLVYAVPKEVKEVKQTVRELALILGLDESEIEKKIQEGSKSYVPLKKNLTPVEIEKINAKKFAGINFDYETIRHYPENNLLSQVLGFVGYKDTERVGIYGLERYFETELKGKEGSIKQEKSSGGAWIFGGRREVVPVQDGDNLLLTIDRNIQFKAESVLQNAVTTHLADSGTIIVMDPKTGAVLAMANYPDFNLNEYNKVEDVGVFNNLATQSAYEPGSVFKAFTMAAALNEGKIQPDSTYVDTGKVVIDKYTIMNSDKKAYGEQTMTQVMEKSLNTGVIFAKNQIGNQQFLKYLKAFGFGNQSGIELMENRGSLENLSGNIETNYMTASFGQGITVTPIQLIKAYGALANNGVMMKPYLVQSRIISDGRVINTDPIAETRVINEKTANMLTAMLVNVIDNGHGKKAGVKGYYIAGKTGTAQVPKANGRGYEENNNIGSFVGYGPVENPRFVVLVRINHPRTVSFAESTAAPAFGELAQFLVNYYNIAPTRN